MLSTMTSLYFLFRCSLTDPGVIPRKEKTPPPVKSTIIRLDSDSVPQIERRESQPSESTTPKTDRLQNANTGAVKITSQEELTINVDSKLDEH